MHKRYFYCKKCHLGYNFKIHYHKLMCNLLRKNKYFILRIIGHEL
ncbi:hypothetical protein NEIMUCOT_04247 [Neisseria mucosa ATCC 25996]|uniref:Uncharacterized protein n=1 Tax=Neisseria mucosa (strain ATCC 25996 / DSM 4631 / NCTC 10774 / M26) TaxID=546266 RepID=D2ZUF9_NEIM2|nr:hypothetical protein NEIMUCOT_04247 [Neisseria mucosa ATCC 25996]